MSSPSALNPVSTDCSFAKLCDSKTAMVTSIDATATSAVTSALRTRRVDGADVRPARSDARAAPRRSTGTRAKTSVANSAAVSVNARMRRTEWVNWAVANRSGGASTDNDCAVTR